MNKLLYLLLIFSVNVFAKVRVAVIDTGIDTYRYPKLKEYMCDSGHKDLTGTTILDVHDHGSNVASLIAQSINPKKACLVIVKYWHMNDDNKKSNENFIKALEYVKELNTDYVNISIQGESSYTKERELLETIKRNGTKIIVAAGNGKYKFTYFPNGKVSSSLQPINLKEDCRIYPACYQLGHNFFVVTANDLKFANFGYPAIYKESGFAQAAFGTVKMSGTSQAAAIFTGKFVGSDHP